MLYYIILYYIILYYIYIHVLNRCIQHFRSHKQKTQPFIIFSLNFSYSFPWMSTFVTLVGNTSNSPFLETRLTFQQTEVEAHHSNVVRQGEGQGLSSRSFHMGWLDPRISLRRLQGAVFCLFCLIVVCLLGLVLLKMEVYN